METTSHAAIAAAKTQTVAATGNKIQMMTAKARSPKLTERRTCRVQCSRFLSPPLATKPRLLLTLALVLFDKRGACAKDRREGQK